MSIKLAKECFVAGPKEFELVTGDIKVKLFAHQIGYVKVQDIFIQSKEAGKDALSSLIVESVKDAEGNQFTYDEVQRLNKDAGKIIQDVVLEVNNLVGEEKK